MLHAIARQRRGAFLACAREALRPSEVRAADLDVLSNDGPLSVSLAEQGSGLAHAFEPMVMEQLRTGRLQRVLEPYAPTVPGYFLYFPSRARSSAPLRLFVEAARELALRAVNRKGQRPITRPFRRW